MGNVYGYIVGLAFGLYIAMAPGCLEKTSEPIPESPCPECDSTELISANSAVDSMKSELIRMGNAYRDSLYNVRSEYDSVNNALILSNYRIERVKYYVGICQRKPSQLKFLVGWTRRALAMNKHKE